MSGIVNPTPASTGANPTASVGLTAVNGSAATFMRSDAAPALDQTAAYAFSGLGKTAITATAANNTPLTASGYSLTGSGTQAGIDLSGTWSTSGVASAIKVNITNTGSGAGSKLLDLQVGGVTLVAAYTGGTITARYFQAIAAGVAKSYFDGSNDGTWAMYNSSDAPLTTLSWGADLKLTHAAAATLQLGAANAASPVAQTLQAQGSRAGTDSNVGGAPITLRCGAGTGTAASTFTIQTYAPVASGSGAQTATSAVSFDGAQTATFGGDIIAGGVTKLKSYTVSTVPSASSKGAGSMIYVTDESGGAVPAFSDATNWRRDTDRAIIS